MRVYGLDFTSSPLLSNPARSSDKLLAMAACELDGTQLRIERFIPLTGSKKAPFEKFEAWLADENGPWICGADFPIGMPLGAIDYFHWCPQSDKQTWQDYVKEIHRESKTVDEFRDRVEQWSKNKLSGESARVFLFRYTDRIGGFGGTTPSSPMKIHTQCNPPVGRMFFEGSKRLLNSLVSIPPVRPTQDSRVIVEAYPRIVADKFIHGRKYKDAKKKDDIKQIDKCRELVLDGLSKDNPYGFTVSFADPDDRRKCLSDGKGDNLDSVLCAVQAAWASRQATGDSEDDVRVTYGIPEFATNCLKQQVSLEGWIVDPLTLSSVQNDSPEEATA